jgi:hypothetical protein
LAKEYAGIRGIFLPIYSAWSPDALFRAAEQWKQIHRYTNLDHIDWFILGGKSPLPELSISRS